MILSLEKKIKLLKIPNACHKVHSWRGENMRVEICSTLNNPPELNSVFELICTINFEFSLEVNIVFPKDS